MPNRYHKGDTVIIRGTTYVVKCTCETEPGRRYYELIDSNGERFSGHCVQMSYIEREMNRIDPSKAKVGLKLLLG